MTPTQVTIRFPAEVGRAWAFTPVGAVPHAGAIRPRRFGFAPDALEAADGTFQVALLATDQAATAWAWQVRDPDNRRRTVTVPAGEGVVDYADLPDAGGGEAPAPLYAPADVAAGPTPEASSTGAEPWMLQVLLDLARRTAAAEALTGTPPGLAVIEPDDDGVQAYLDGFRYRAATD